jgi:hypothetical protein
MRTFRSVAVLLVSLALAGCDLCGNDILQTSVSPSRNFNAFVFTRSCGATTPNFTEVAVLPANVSLPDDPGNVFSVRGEFPVTLRWKSDAILEVNAQVTGTLHESMVNGISIEYTRGDAF